MKYLQLIFFILTYSMVGAQFDGTINGVITIQNSKTNSGSLEYVKNADVWADDANPVISDNLGNFTLDYDSKKQGDPTTIRIEKRGYEVVNINRLTTHIPSDPTELLPIYMCKEGKLAATILNFRGIGVSQITKSYEEKIIQLKKEKKATAKELLKLENQKDVAIDQLKILVRKLAVINLDDEPEVYTKAYQLFEQNKVDEARKIIEEADLDSQIQEYKESKELGEKMVAGATKALEGSAKTYVFDAQLALIRLDFKSAFESYNKAIRATDTTILEHNLEYALLLNSQYRIEPAIQIFTKSLELSNDDPSQYAYNQFLLGAAYMGKLDFNMSIHYINNASKIYDSLDINSGIDYKPLKAVTQLVLAGMHGFLGDHAAVIENSRENINLFKVLAQENPKKYNAYLAWSMIIGSIALTSEEVDDLINLSRALQKENGDNYSVFVAVSLFLKALRLSPQEGITNLQEKLDYEAKVLTYLEEAFDITNRELNTINSSSATLGLIINGSDSIPYFEDVLAQSDIKTNMLLTYVKIFAGMSTWIFGTPDINSKFYKLSREALENATVKSKSLMELNEDRFTPHYLEFSAILGQLYGIEGKIEKAITILEESYDQTKPLYLKEPETFELLIAINRVNLYSTQALYYTLNGSFYKNNKHELDKIIPKYKPILLKHQSLGFMNVLLDALNQWEECFEREYYPEFLLLRAFQETSNISRMSLDRNDYYSTVNNATINLDLLERLNETYYNIDDALLLFQKYEVWIDLYGEMNDLDSLLHYGKKQMDVLERVWMSYDNTEEQFDFALEFGNLAWYLSLLGDYEGAIKYAKKGLKIDPEQTWINTNLALGYLGNNEWNNTIRIYAEHYDKKYADTLDTSFKDIYLQDLDTLEITGFDSELIKQARNFLNNPSKWPKELKNGINKIKEAHAHFYNTSYKDEQRHFKLAKDKYEDLLKADYFFTYFKSDFKKILLNLSHCYYKLNIPTSKLALPKDENLLNETTQEIIENTWNIFKYGLVKNYQDLIFEMGISKLLIAQLRLINSSNPSIYNLESTYLRNLVEFYIYNGQIENAVNLIDKTNENQFSIWFTSRRIVCHVLNDELDKAEALFVERNNKITYDQDRRDFKIHLSDNFHNLKKAGVYNKTIQEFIKKLQLFE